MRDHPTRRRRRSATLALGATALIAVSLFGFGGVYTWIAALLVMGAVILAFAAKPQIFSPADCLPLDYALVAIVVAIAIQLIPIPTGVLWALAPGAREFSLAAAPGAPSGVWLPVSIDCRSTFHALGVLTASLLLFWTCRDAFGRGGVRLFLAGVTWIGLAVAVLAILQRFTAPESLFWRWQPVNRPASPVGPFVNANHFATWIVMAIPTAMGYALLRTQSGPEPPAPEKPSPWLDVARVFDPLTAWVLVAIAGMVAAALISLSRSGLVALGAAAVAFGLLGRTRLRRPVVLWLVLALCAVSLLVGLLLVGDRMAGEIETSLEQAGTHQDPDRITIWRETLPIVRDFWLTGTGAGTFAHAMPVYQRSHRLEVYFNHAHNHYLQVAAEGGLLLVAPVVASVVALVRVARRRFRSDDSATFWVRVGGLAALVGVAVQSIWETGLRMPANAFLCAALAALAIAKVRTRAAETLDRPVNGWGPAAGDDSARQAPVSIDAATTLIR